MSTENNDRVYNKIASQSGAKKTEEEVKLRSENFYLKYNRVNKHLTIGTETNSMHYAYITITPSHVVIRARISENDYFKVKVRKTVNVQRIVKRIIDLEQEIDIVLRSEGIELE